MRNSATNDFGGSSRVLHLQYGSEWIGVSRAALMAAFGIGSNSTDEVRAGLMFEGWGRWNRGAIVWKTNGVVHSDAQRMLF